MAKSENKEGKAVTITVPKSAQYAANTPAERTAGKGEAAKPGTSFTFHGQSRITTSGVPIKSR